MPRKVQAFNPIRPCPFCGGEGELFVEREDYFEPTEMYMRCLECGAKGSFAFNPEEACAHWNKRYIVPKKQIERDRKAMEPVRETLDDLSNDELAVHLSEMGGLFNEV